MKKLVVGVCVFVLCFQCLLAEEKQPVVSSDNDKIKQEITDLSKQKWAWMSDKDVDSLGKLFHDEAVFVYMGGAMSKEQELGVIEGGGIHYKKADIQETSVRVIGKTAILLSRLRLEAVVGGNEVVNPFMVTEVYIHEKEKWQLGSLSFTRLLGQ